jgi:hypothetical protein
LQRNSAVEVGVGIGSAKALLRASQLPVLGRSKVQHDAPLTILDSSVQAGQITSATFPIAVPSAPGNPAGVWEMYRLAAPHPTILPSYDQIGFDSLHFLIGIVSAITGADTAVINPPRGVTGRRQR